MRNSIAAGAAQRPLKVVPKAEKKYQQGLALMRQGRWDEAARAFEAAIERSPKDAVFWLNLAQARRKLGRAESAIEAARRAVALDPDSALARRMLGLCLNESGLHEQAAAALDARVGTDAERATVLTERGLALQRAGQMRASIEPLLQAARLEPTAIKTYIALSDAFKGLDMPEAAWECQRTAVALDANNPYLLCSLIHLGLSACKWEGLNEATTRLAELCAAGAGPAPVPFMHLSVPGASAQQHLRTAQAHCARSTGHVQPLPPVGAARRRPGRIRVGYFSNDFHSHATAYLMARVLELHDRSAFEVFAYSYGPDDGSPMRRRLEAAVEHFVDVQHESARTTAERIRADGIDLLIDLKGYTLNARPEVLAFRPAPIQVNYLGYPGTMGAPFIDYIVTDPVVTPPSMADDYTEKFAYLPDSYQPNDDTRPTGPPPPRADCGLPDNAFVFCCFNNTYKITPEIFDVWCRLLQAVPNSVLWLLDANLQAKHNLWREAQARGVARERVIFAPKWPYERHLLRIQHADLFLDNLPYNAHTTASDALWAGVPIVTCPGPTFASRVAASLLRAAGVTETIASSLAEYESIALRLARAPQELTSLRARLVANRGTCALFDSRSFTRNLEHLYERMFERWQRGLPADYLEPCAAIARGAVARAPADASPPASSPWAAQRLPVCPTPTRQHPLRVAVITPYYCEERALLERCIRSVQDQTYPATHLVVADGHPQAWLDDSGVRHLRLDCPHADYGDTPRAIGGLLAISEGFDALCFLDADNWLDPEHVQLCVAAALGGEHPDYVIARRRFARLDGSALAIPDSEEAHGHVDTGCYFLLRGAFHTVARWATMPRPLACVGDRVYGATLRADGLRSVRVDRPTVNYLCTWASLFAAAGETPPDYAKLNVDPAPALRWWRELPARDRLIAERLVGAAVQLA